MSRQELLKCETCGSYIDPETGETLPPLGGNAKKITQMTETIVQLEKEVAELKASYKLLQEKGESGDGTEKGQSIIDDIL